MKAKVIISLVALTAISSCSRESNPVGPYEFSTLIGGLGSTRSYVSTESCTQFNSDCRSSLPQLTMTRASSTLLISGLEVPPSRSILRGRILVPANTFF